MTSSLPALIQTPGHLPPAGDFPRRKSPQEAAEEFFASQIANDHTRSNYLRDVRRFASWCAGRGLTLHAITPVDVAAYRDQLLAEKKATTASSVTYPHSGCSFPI